MLSLPPTSRPLQEGTCSTALLHTFLSIPKGTPRKGWSYLAKLLQRFSSPTPFSGTPTRLPGLILPVCFAEQGPWGASPVAAQSGCCWGGGLEKVRVAKLQPWAQFLFFSQLAQAHWKERNGGREVVRLAEHTIQGSRGRVSGWGLELKACWTAAYSR